MHWNEDVLELVLAECDKSTLRAVSLVCKGVRDPAQRHLFKQVELRGLKHCYFFLDVLTDRLTAYVRELSVNICRCATQYHDLLHALVSRCLRLKSLTLENTDLDLLAIVRLEGTGPVLSAHRVLDNAAAADTSGTTLPELESISLIGAGVLTDFVNALAMTQLPVKRLCATRLYCVPNLSAIVHTSPNLCELSIGPMANVSLAAFTIALRNALPALTKLTIDGWDSFPLGSYGTARPQAEKLVGMLSLASKLESLTVHLHCLHELLLPLVENLPRSLVRLHIDTTSFPDAMASLTTFLERLASLPRLRTVVLEGYTSDSWTRRMDAANVKGWKVEQVAFPCSAIMMARS